MRRDKSEQAGKNKGEDREWKMRPPPLSAKEKDVTQNAIDEALENGWSIGKTKRKNQILVVSRGGVERRLPLIPPPEYVPDGRRCGGLIWWRPELPATIQKPKTLEVGGTCSLR